MNKALLPLAATFLILPCFGCTSDTDSSSSENTETAPPLTYMNTTAAENETTALQSETNSATAAISADQQGNAAETSAFFQGGIGDEEHAETARPEFFVYRFQPSGFSARLAGGNYQTVTCDLSAAIEHRIDEEYYLEDYDIDGYYDLYIPASYDTDEIVLSYYVFCWNPAEELFRTEPLTVQAELNT